MISLLHPAVSGHGAPKGKRHREFSIPAPKGQWEQQFSRITNAPARLGCAEPPWTFAIGFARRDPAALPVQGTTSHPTGCRRGQIGRILRAARRASFRAPSRLGDGPAPRPRRDRLHELGANATASAEKSVRRLGTGSGFIGDRLSVRRARSSRPATG